MTPRGESTRWRKASRSGGTNGNCIELASTLDAVRDSKQPNGPQLTVDVRRLVEAVQAGRYQV